MSSTLYPARLTVNLKTDHTLQERLSAGDLLQKRDTTGYVRAIKNPFGISITLTTASGDKKKGNEHCWVTVELDTDGNPTANYDLISLTALIQQYCAVE